MKEVFLAVGIVFVWYALQAWILPRMGIPTCMSGACCGAKTNRPAAQTVPGDEQTDDERSCCTKSRGN